MIYMHHERLQYTLTSVAYSSSRCSEGKGGRLLKKQRKRAKFILDK